MERKKAEKGKIERLAQIKAKRRLKNWSEEFYSWWLRIFVVVVFLSWIGMWVAWSDGGFAIAVPVIITLVIAVLAWFIYLGYRVWKKEKLCEFYKEELLELRLKT